MPTSMLANRVSPTASESTLARETETLPPALWPSFAPMILTSSCLARSLESSEVPAPVARMNSNGPSALTVTGRRMSGCAPPARRNFTREAEGEIVAALMKIQLPLRVAVGDELLEDLEAQFAIVQRVAELAAFIEPGGGDPR